MDEATGKRCVSSRACHTVDFVNAIGVLLLRPATSLFDPGYDPATRWRGAPPDAWLGSKSAAYLRRTGQSDDLDFILRHVDDLREIFMLHSGEVVALSAAAGGAA